MTEPERIAYRTSSAEFIALAWGSRDGDLALCLHGYPDTAWTWRRLAPLLAERGLGVVAPFLRGYAPTGLARDGVYQVGALIRDAVEAHEALGGDEHALLIGHDWGAVTAYGAGAHCPERFRGMVTLAVPPPAALRSTLRLPADLPVLLRQLRSSWYMLFQQLPVVPERLFEPLVRRLWQEWSPGYESEEDIRLVLESLGGEHTTAALRYYRALLRPWARSRAYAAEQRQWLRLPRVPTLYLHGSEDGCLLPELAERAATVLRGDNGFAMLPGAGHFLQLELPADVDEHIARFTG